MTGLDVENDALVEVGVLVTDADLNILGLSSLLSPVTSLLPVRWRT